VQLRMYPRAAQNVFEPGSRRRVCTCARAQLFRDATWLRRMNGIPLEAAISATHPQRNLARCSAMRRRGSSGGDGVWTVTEAFACSLQVRPWLGQALSMRGE